MFFVPVVFILKVKSLTGTHVLVHDMILKYMVMSHKNHKEKNPKKNASLVSLLCIFLIGKYFSMRDEFDMYKLILFIC